MDPGIGHEIEVDLQAYGYPVLWAQYFPIDADLMDWAFGEDVRGGQHPLSRSTSATCGRRPTAQHQRDPVGREGGGADAVGGVRGAAGQLRVRDGPADLHAGAADRRALGHAVLLVPGSRLDQARGLGEDPGRDHRPLPRAVRGDIIAKKKAAMPPGCPLLPARAPRRLRVCWSVAASPPQRTADAAYVFVTSTQASSTQRDIHEEPRKEATILELTQCCARLRPPGPAVRSALASIHFLVHLILPKKAGAVTGPIGALALFTAAVVSGCTTVIPLKATVENPPSIAQVPLVVGVHYSLEFRTYEHERSKVVFPLGQSSVILFDQVLPIIFAQVVRVPSPAPLSDGGPRVAAVIEPKIEDADFTSPRMIVSLADVTAEVIYRFTVYSPQGSRLASWKVKGIGKPSPGWFVWKTEPFSKAMDLAMVDAARKLMTGFRDVPEVQQWLREVGIPEVR